MTSINVSETIFIVLAALSGSFSLLIILTGCFWPRVMLSKSRPFSKTVFFISICDFCVSIFNCLGFPLNNSDQCSIQAAGLFYFSPTSWLWTTMLVLQLKNLITFKTIHVSMFWMHCICWSIPLFFLLLPLSTNGYGTDDTQNGKYPCDLSGNPATKYVWIDTCSTGAAFMCFLLMAFWTWEIYMHCRKKGGSSSGNTVGNELEREMSFLNIMKWYPLALFVTWVPRFVVTVILTAKLVTFSVGASIAPYFFMISSQYGTLSAIIYFSGSPVSRVLWLKLLKKVVCYSSFFPWDVRRAEGDEDDSDERLISQDAAESDEDALVNRNNTLSASTMSASTMMAMSNLLRNRGDSGATFTRDSIDNPLANRRDDSIIVQI